MAHERQVTDPLLALATAGDAAAWSALLASHKQRLARMVKFRMDRRLRGRIDAADVGGTYQARWQGAGVSHILKATGIERRIKGIMSRRGRF